MKEKWLPIKGYEGLYEISNLGRVKSLKRNYVTNRGNLAVKKERIIGIPKEFKGNYLNVTLRKFGKQKSRDIHRLVALAFIPNKNNLPEVNHKDTIKTNNCASNLEWCTRRENHDHAIQNGLILGHKGEDNSFSVLTEKKVIKLRTLYKTGDFCVAELARKFSVSFNCASYAIKRKTWRHI